MPWKWRLAPEINPMQYCQYKGSCRLQLHLSRHLNPFHPAYMHKKLCRKIDANRQWHGPPPLTLRILPGPDWKNPRCIWCYAFCLRLASWNFHGFLVSLFQSTAWVSFSIFDCVDKTHPVGSVVLCRSSMLQLEYFTGPLDVLHRSWTMLKLGKKTIAVRPFAATLIPESQAFL